MTEGRLFNFSAGPAILPESALHEVRDNLLNYKGSGVGIMEMSHRGSHFQAIIDETESLLRSLLGLSEDYAILFTTGGATNQFSMVPLNLLSSGDTASYLITGTWAKNAYKEAKRFFPEVSVAASSEKENFSHIPSELSLLPNSKYLHFTSNNTIFGTQFTKEPDAGNIPLVCDASSDFLHKPLDMSKYGLIYAGAQKNLGPAGVTLVIIRKDLISDKPSTLPIMMNYKTYADSQSLYNTPATLPIYVVKEVLKWLVDQGGLKAIEVKNRRKANLLYAQIDSSDFYTTPVNTPDRSLMNVVFRIRDESLEAEFISQASKRGLLGLKGHRSVGGMRASIYNAFPEEGVLALVELMKEFEQTRG